MTKREAILGSIDKLKRIAKREDVDDGTKNCPLCQKYLNKKKEDKSCLKCPVSKLTGDTACLGTPYVKWRWHQWKTHLRGAPPYKNQCSYCTRLANQGIKLLEEML